MAAVNKGSKMTNLFVATTKEGEGVLEATGKAVTCGVGLRQSEADEIDRLAKQLGVARNAMLRFAVRHFLVRVQSGEIDLSAYRQVTESVTLKMP